MFIMPFHILGQDYTKGKKAISLRSHFLLLPQTVTNSSLIYDIHCNGSHSTARARALPRTVIRPGQITYSRSIHLFYVLKNSLRRPTLKDSTHNVEDGEDEEQVVEDAVHPLPRERPDGDAVAEHADDADDEDEQPLGRPLKFSKDPRSSFC